ncbi:MAG: putative periplasmic protein [Deltaproteobacteria bacterium]|nr:putative periplasmic protein [Deltaproteobacteria bacterium]
MGRVQQALVVWVACNSGTPAPPAAEPQHAVTRAKAGAEPAAPIETCPDLHFAAPTTLELTSGHDTAVPDVIDFGGHSLDPFFDKLARVARRIPGETLRIGMYGDSNWTNDRTAGEIRRRLQGLFGDSGHGWVAFGEPWGWYHHNNLQHGVTGKWTPWNLSTMENRDGLYGFAGIAAESTQAGATVWAATAKTGDPVGTVVTTFELYYLARPNGGSFEVLIDGRSHELVTTHAATTEMKFLRYPVSEGPHRLTVKVTSGRVRVFGVTLERDATGVVVDGLGVSALNALNMLRMNPAQLSAGLAHRGYDLVVETTGTNMWSPRNHPIWMARIIALWRAALPSASFLLWSPPDFVAKGRPTPTFSEPRMRSCTKEKRDIAEANKIGFWNQYEALGGWGSMPKWLKELWSEPDGVHLGPRMNRYVGERFVFAIAKELARRVEQNPKLGCPQSSPRRSID